MVVGYTAVFRVEGALRDDTKNGCVADYPNGCFGRLMQDIAEQYPQ